MTKIISGFTAFELKALYKSFYNIIMLKHRATVLRLYKSSFLRKLVRFTRGRKVHVAYRISRIQKPILCFEQNIKQHDL